MNSLRLNSLSLKYQRLTPSDGKDMRIRKSEFVSKLSFFNIFVKSDKELYATTTET